MEITTKTKKLAVIGDPIGHSLSPFIHNSVIEADDLDAVYFPFNVKEVRISEFLNAAKELGFVGFNVTMPHKVKILSLLDELDSEAEVFGAVNTVKIFPDGRTKGFNTDVRGLLMAFEGHNVCVQNSKIMIIGAGGIAGALIKSFEAAGAKEINIFNRTYKKAYDLSKDIFIAESHEWNNKNMKKIADKSDIIVNCTPLGMDGIEEDFEDLTFLDRTSAYVCDLIYSPQNTKFISYARARGLDTMNGLDLLIYQALLSLQIYLDKELDCHGEYDRILPLCQEKLIRYEIEKKEKERAEAERLVAEKEAIILASEIKNEEKEPIDDNDQSATSSTENNLNNETNEDKVEVKDESSEEIDNQSIDSKLNEEETLSIFEDEKERYVEESAPFIHDAVHLADEPVLTEEESEILAEEIAKFEKELSEFIKKPYEK